ncbi:phosphate/phosphite/phosphonate ABC transporter substrate-binding protein [Pseudomonas sp. Pseusp122]|uniref:phosphate/phosphite/phosphonate ABC transporter substrate-binding protein n=1 Tax=unclassified Pseudomonas TaxID=196821 RepID=UPI0039A5B5D7
MIHGLAELLMYVAPPRVCEAQQTWLREILRRLNAERLSADGLDLPRLWLSPDLLLTQTCGYPLMTRLQGKVQVVGRPVYHLPHSADGNHCSLLLVREDDPRQNLADFYGSHGLLNSADSNSGMNLLRQRLAPLQRDGRFFAQVSFSGGHRDSLRLLKARRGDLAAIDSVTYDYLARDHSEEVTGLRILIESAASPCLPYITARDVDPEPIRQAMNSALLALPEVAEILAIEQVLPASEADYHVLLDYEREAQALGLASINP